jgi:hypothetical protein
VGQANDRDAQFRRWAEQRDREFRDWAEKHDRQMHVYLDGLTERHVRITQQLIESISMGFDRLATQISSATAELQAEIADQRAQIQANTQALLRLLDRLGPA